MPYTNKIETRNGIKYAVFRCDVIEEGAQCNNHHLEPVMSREEVMAIGTSAFICPSCDTKGYRWYSRLLGNTDENGQLVSEIITEAPGARNNEFRLTSNSYVDGNRQVARPTVDSTQTSKGEKGTQALVGWSAVRHYPEYNDVLMLRNSEAKDPGKEYVARKQRTVVGIANAPSSDNPFEEMFS